MSTHTIRLAGPWEQCSEGTQQASVRCQLPAFIPANESAILLARAFHRPTRLAADTQVHVVVKSCHSDLELRLNEAVLSVVSKTIGARKENSQGVGSGSAADPAVDPEPADIHRLATGDSLRDFNRLTVNLKRRSDEPHVQAGLLSVALEIIEPET